MSIMYDEYLKKHIKAVGEAYLWLCDNLPEVTRIGMGTIILDHDRSKFDISEYDAYDKYFYGNNKSYAVVQNFNKAWLHHIHNNPHHWQHWVLIEDDGKENDYICIEMPEEYAIEMICDWWSFSFSKGDLREIFDWYKKHDNIKLHPKTKKFVEHILDEIKHKLDELEEEKE